MTGPKIDRKTFDKVNELLDSLVFNAQFTPELVDPDLLNKTFYLKGRMDTLESYGYVAPPPPKMPSGNIEPEESAHNGIREDHS